jgi:signal peptidase I
VSGRGECNKGGAPPARRRLGPGFRTPEPPPTYTAELVTKRPALGCLLEIVETLVLTLIIFFVIQTFVAQPYRVQQVSMERTLEPDQYVLVDKLTPRFDAYKRGDIVVFNPPPNWVQAQGQPYIKRVIGIGGDTVELKGGKVLVNGTALVEHYVYQEDGDSQPTDALIGVGKWVVPTGQLFLMGDHRSNSADSREFGPVDISAVIGRAWLRYWPINTFQILPTPDHPELATPAP